VFEPAPAPGPHGRYDTRNEYFFGEYQTDPQGRLIFELPAQGITRAILAMRAPGYTDATQQLEFAALRGDLILKLNRKEPPGARLNGR